MDNLEVSQPEPVVPGIDPIKLAVGLAREDRWLLMPLLAVVSIMTPVQLLMSDSNALHWGLMLSTDRVLQMLVCTIVAVRWRGRLEAQGARGPSFVRAFGKNLLIGMLVWLGITVPALIMGTAQDQLLSMLAAASTAMCLLVAMRLFFSFAVSGLIGGSLKDVLAHSRLLTLRAPGAPYRAAIGPLAITIALVAACSAPYPDGRSLSWSLLTAVAENIFWVASSYTGLAFALVLIDDSSWRVSGLGPYRRERLQTLERKGRGVLSRFLAPSGAWKLLVVALLLLSGTMFRLMSEAPAPQISLVDAAVSDKKIALTIRVSDPNFDLRGFSPSAFSLRGSSGLAVSKQLVTASSSGTAGERLVQIAPTAEPVTLLLEFETDRGEEDLRALVDLHLWYNLHQLMRLELRGK